MKLQTQLVDEYRSEPVSQKKVTPRYVLLANWPVQEGSGVNNVIVGLSQAIRASGVEPQIVVTGWMRPIRDEQVWLRLVTPRMPLRNLLGFAWRFVPSMIALRRLTRGAIAVNSHYSGPELLPLLVLRMLGLAPKLIFSVHGADVHDASRSHHLYRKLYAWVCQKADLVVACSGSLASKLLQISPKAKVVPIWNGISDAPRSFGARPIASPYLLSVAAFVPKKGHDVLLNAFRLVADRFPKLKLVLIGNEGPERGRVAELIQELGLEGRVEMRLSVPHSEIWNWLHHAECFVHAAREEPFGISVLEAGLAQIPVVTTGVGGINEYFSDCVHGLKVEPDQPRQFAAALLETLTDTDAARRRARAFAERARRFTWEAAWQQYREAAELE